MLHRVLTLVAALSIAGALFQQLPAQQTTAEPPGPDTVRYTPKLGTVTFTHAKHAKSSECVACHHESRPERPSTKPHQACGACHVAEPVPPMTTDLRNAFHNTSTKSGVCFDCHKAAASTTVPTACGDCHKRQGA
jgi:hypothetical protein